MSIEAIFRLDGLRALVTGASSGLGRHFAKVLAQAGAEVVLAARRADALADAVAGIEAAGGRASAITLDVGSINSVVTALDQIAETRGPLDIVVNNAGVAISKAALQQTEEDWDQVLDTNLKGSWLVATETARRWLAAGRGGCIVNIASILAERVIGHTAPYAASKAALVQLTRALALEWAPHDIRVNALLPGYVITDLNRDFLTGPSGERLRGRVPSKRFAEPSDLDGGLLLLTSSAGCHISGAALAIDGGHLVASL